MGTGQKAQSVKVEKGETNLRTNLETIKLKMEIIRQKCKEM
jgi:hypothetical protein